MNAVALEEMKPDERLQFSDRLRRQSAEIKTLLQHIAERRSEYDRLSAEAKKDFAALRETLRDSFDKSSR